MLKINYTDRSSQIVCTNRNVTTVYERACKQRYAYTEIRTQYWFLCVKIIWICECALLFCFPFAWLLPLLAHRVFMLPPYALIFLLVCFYGNWFCSPTINQISLGQSKGWFPFISKHFWPIRKLIWFHKNQKSVRIKNYLLPIYTDHYALKK